MTDGGSEEGGLLVKLNETCFEKGFITGGVSALRTIEL